MSLNDVKRELKNHTKEELIQLISELYKMYKPVKEHLDVYVDPDENNLYVRTVDKVFLAFYPKRGYVLKLQEGIQAIRDFKKLGGHQIQVAELLLFYVETGVKLSNEYGDLGERFYDNLFKHLEEALLLMKSENVLDDFHARVSLVVDNSSNMPGWGFADLMCQIYLEFYEEDFPPSIVLPKEAVFANDKPKGKRGRPKPKK